MEPHNHLLFALSNMVGSPPSTQPLNQGNRDALLLQLSQAQAAAAANPRISRALRELEAAEALLARTKIARSMAAVTSPMTTAPVRSPWMFNPMIPGSSPSMIHAPLQTSLGLPPGPPLPPLVTPECSPELVHSRKSIFPGPPRKGVTLETSDAMSVSESTTTSMCQDPQEFVDEVRDNDILCGRGGKSNHHPGNKKYRLVISRMKMNYRKIGSKMLKTDLSRAIVEHVYGYGGRFLKYDKDSSKYAVLSPAESRKKTSQALREMKEVKWVS